MRPLPKHLRPRWRYLAVEFETWPDGEMTRAAFERGIWRACRELAGDVGCAETDMRVYEFTFNAGRGEAVVRTRRGTETLARAAIATIDEINEAPIRNRIRGISGTVRGCEEKYLGRHRQPHSETSVTIDGVDLSAVRRGDELDVQTDDTFVGATTLDFE